MKLPTKKELNWLERVSKDKENLKLATQLILMGWEMPSKHLYRKWCWDSGIMLVSENRALVIIEDQDDWGCYFLKVLFRKS